MKATAIILITTLAPNTKACFEELGQKEIVDALFAVTGPYDIIAILKPQPFDEIGKLVTEHVHSIVGIERTTTCISFEI